MSTCAPISLVPWDGGASLDAHCHVGFVQDPAGYAAQARERGVRLLSMSCDPWEFSQVRQVVSDGDGLRLGLGWHPWWVNGCADPAEGLALFDELLPETRLVGEVGLDYRHDQPDDAARERQRRVLAHVLDRCATAGDRVLSLHCVGAHEDALRLLAESGVCETCTVFFHWFSGSCDDLHRAIDLGCWFSVGERMASSRRGREYVRQIPRDRLLLETDLPEQGATEPFAAQEASLKRASALIAGTLGH